MRALRELFSFDDATAMRAGRVRCAVDVAWLSRRCDEESIMPTVECPNCLTRLNAPVEHKGRTVTCGECGKAFVLRFLDKDAPTLSAKILGNRSEPGTDQLKSTIAFRMPEKPATDPQEPPPSSGSTHEDRKAKLPQKPRRKKPHRED